MPVVDISEPNALLAWGAESGLEYDCRLMNIPV